MTTAAEENQDRGDDFVPTGDDVDTTTEQPRGDDGKFVKKEAEKAEETTTEEAETETEDQVEEESPLKLIAKSRYDFKAAQAKQLAAKNAELEAKLREYEAAEKKTAKTDEPDYAAELAALDKQIAEARKDGNTDLAIDLLDKKSELRVKMALQPKQEQSTVDPTKLTADAIDQIKADELIDRLEEAFDVLNPEHKDYDETLVEEIVDLRSAFQARGYSRVDALSRAANYVLAPLLKDAGSPKVDDKPAPGKRVTDIKKNLDAKKRMPPDVTKIATPSDKLGLQGDLPEVHKLSEKDFAALPDSVRRRARGDFLE